MCCVVLRTHRCVFSVCSCCCSGMLALSSPLHTHTHTHTCQTLPAHTEASGCPAGIALTPSWHLNAYSIASSGENLVSPLSARSKQNRFILRLESKMDLRFEVFPREVWFGLMTRLIKNTTYQDLSAIKP